jgi:hypothetical protein
MVSFKTEEDEDDVNVSWKRKHFDVWFHNSHEILKAQLARHDFAGEIDFAPKQVTDQEMGAHHYQDIMSGHWAWDQAVRDVRSYIPQPTYQFFRIFFRKTS